MATPENRTTEELERARDVGAAMYFNAYVRLMARHLGIDESDRESINSMATLMIDPMIAAMDATWCALMSDGERMEQMLSNFGDKLDQLKEEIHGAGDPGEHLDASPPSGPADAS